MQLEENLFLDTTPRGPAIMSLLTIRDAEGKVVARGELQTVKDIGEERSSVRPNSGINDHDQSTSADFSSLDGKSISYGNIQHMEKLYVDEDPFLMGNGRDNIPSPSDMRHDMKDKDDFEDSDSDGAACSNIRESLDLKIVQEVDVTLKRGWDVIDNPEHVLKSGAESNRKEHSNGNFHKSTGDEQSDAEMEDRIKKSKRSDTEGFEFSDFTLVDDFEDDCGDGNVRKSNDAVFLNTFVNSPGAGDFSY